jgi:adenosylhomocysteine nucleosidase
LKRVGILVPLLPEAACLMRGPRAGQVQALSAELSLDVCGLGRERARAGVARLLQHGAEALVSLGTAGALDPDLSAGDIVMPASVIRPEGAPLATHERWRRRAMQALAGLPVHGGSLLDAGEVIASVQEKRRLHAASGALAVDMESAALVQEAGRQGLPALVVRVVIDRADLAIPDCVLRGSDAYGRTRPLRLLGALLGRPRQLAPLLRLARGYRHAALTLRMLGQDLARLQPPA